MNGPLGVPKVSRWTMRMSKSERRLTPYLDGPIMTWSARPEPTGRPFINSRLAAHHRIERKGSNMAKASPLRLLLIVTGSTLRAEEMDRPLGYYLKQRIEGILSASADQAGSKLGHDLSDYQVRVIADFRWIHDEFLQSLPTISLGGPGVNALRIAGSRRYPSRWHSTSGISSKWIPISTSLASASGAWTTPRPRLPSPFSWIGFFRRSWNDAPWSPRRLSTWTMRGEGEAETDPDESEDD